MPDFYANMKKSAITWNVINFFWNALALLGDRWAFLQKKIRQGLARGENLGATRHSLKQFIHHCQHQPSAPIPWPAAEQEIAVSIIIPVYNQWQLTRACLNSILNTCTGDVNYELILADDCSTDETRNAAACYPGLIVVKTDKNSGFLQNCNHAARKARGRYLLLLNNDTIVLPGWLASLYQTICADERIAIVGSKILGPTGRIQEAGSVIFQNGATLNLGYGALRDTPFLNTLRDADYISGCSLLICKSFWDRAGGFDPRYKNAYYEDTDLAMQAHQQGMRVVYQPDSELVHFLHKSYGHNHQQLLENNKQLFLDKWGPVLKKHAPPDAPWQVAMLRAEQFASLAALHRRSCKRFNILYYSPIPVAPASHGNRARMCSLMNKFTGMGHQVHFVMLENNDYNSADLQAMQQQFTSVDVIACNKTMVSLGRVPYDGWYKEGIGEQVYALCKRYDIDVVLCSYIYQSKLLEFVPAHILKIIDTHDKMGDRAEMLRRNKLPSGHFSCTPEEEGTYLQRADVVIGITAAEARYFAQVSGQDNALVISHLSQPQFLTRSFASLTHIGIVASNNQFNLAVVQKFLECLNSRVPADEAFPFVIHVAGEVKNAVAKRIFDPKMKVFNKPWVKMHGYLADISAFYLQMDLLVSPMLCGTGINIKTVEAMAHGMPLLTTAHGSRGMDLHDRLHQHPDMDSLVTSLFWLREHARSELPRLAALSREQFMLYHEKNEANCQLLFEHPHLKRKPMAGDGNFEKN